MIFPRFNLFLVAALAGTAEAFSPMNPPVLGGTVLMSSVSPELDRDEIDISGVMSEVEAALQLAAESVSDPKSTDLDLEGKIGSLKAAWDDADNKNQVVATAVAGSALGVVAGSPLVLGAALGMAGSKLLDDSEEGLRNRQILEKVSKQLGEKLAGAAEYAKTEYEKEEDPSKIPEKMMLAVQSRAKVVQAQANEAPALVAQSVKETIESEEFQEELKQAPGRAFQALRAFVQSDEVKAASGSALKAIKETMESEEVKALQSRASQALQESLKNKKP